MSSHYRPGDQVLFQDLQGEAVVVNLASGIYYRLNALGGRVWSLILAGHSPQQVVDELVRDYEVSAEQAAHDVHKLLDVDDRCRPLRERRPLSAVVVTLPVEVPGHEAAQRNVIHVWRCCACFSCAAQYRK